MVEAAVHIRRMRRTDFAAVMRLLAETGRVVPPPDRATLRRFRQLVADLGADVYVAFVDAALAGLVHVTYARQLVHGPLARIDHLVVAEPVRRRGVGTALLRFALARAAKRRCSAATCAVDPDVSGPTAFLVRAGFYPSANRMQYDFVRGD
jgi:ribosomal protein S18 acetylase RimI-like enzyme